MDGKTHCNQCGEMMPFSVSNVEGLCSDCRKAPQDLSFAAISGVFTVDLSEPKATFLQKMKDIDAKAQSVTPPDFVSPLYFYMSKRLFDELHRKNTFGGMLDTAPNPRNNVHGFNHEGTILGRMSIFTSENVIPTRVHFTTLASCMCMMSQLFREKD